MLINLEKEITMNIKITTMILTTPLSNFDNLPLSSFKKQYLKAITKRYASIKDAQALAINCFYIQTQNLQQALKL